MALYEVLQYYHVQATFPDYAVGSRDAILLHYVNVNIILDGYWPVPVD